MRLFKTLTLVWLLSLSYTIKAQTWNDRLVYTLKTAYEQDFTTNQWDGTKFYNQWTAITTNTFVAADISNGYLQFAWTEKRIINSKLKYTAPYIFEAKIGYGTGGRFGGIVIRGVGNNGGDAVQEPAETSGGNSFNSEGIAFYPSVTGDSLIVQFSGVFVRNNTPVTRIKVAKPNGVTNFKDLNTFRIEDHGTSIYVFVNNNPFVLIRLADKTELNYTTGTLYNAAMELVGSFTDRLVREVGFVSICQRVATLQLYTAKIQVPDIKTQTVDNDFVSIKTTTSAPFKLIGTASSGLPVSFKYVSGPAVLNGDNVTLTGKTGVVNLLIEQAGNTEYGSVSRAMSFYVTTPEKLLSAVPVTGLLICCRGSNRGPFLINGEWNGSHNYADIDVVRGILTNIQNAGINTVMIDMTNPSMWTYLWPTFEPMCENIRAVCKEKGMEYFVMIGMIFTDGTRIECGQPTRSEISDIAWWNIRAKYIYENWAIDSHYRTYGFGNNKKILSNFYYAEWLYGADGKSGNWAKTPAAEKDYFDKFYLGCHEYNVDTKDMPTSGWGYRDLQQSSDSTVRFVSPTSGLYPGSAVHINAETWSERLDWASKAKHYSVYGTYDDNNDNIHWGINDTKNAEAMYKYPGDDPYYYYNVLKKKLTSTLNASFSKPLNKSTLASNSNIDVDLNVTSEYPVTNVKLYLNDVLVSEDTHAPYQWDSSNPMLKNVADGYYALKAVATSSDGNFVISKINITVGAPSLVSFTIANNTSFTAPANITIETKAVNNVSLASVKLYIGDTFLGEKLTAPYTWGGRTAPKLQNMPAGNYTLKAIARDVAGNISETSINIIVLSPAGVSEITQSMFKLYPNPATHELNIRPTDIGFEYAEIAIYNTIGDKVISQPISGSHSTINIKHLPVGVYIIKLMQNEKMYLERFIKK